MTVDELDPALLVETSDLSLTVLVDNSVLFGMPTVLFVDVMVFLGLEVLELGIS